MVLSLRMRELVCVHVGGSGEKVGKIFWDEIQSDPGDEKSVLLYNNEPRSVFVDNPEGSSNCYAQAFHTDGPPIATNAINEVRKQLERCESNQGIHFFHSTCGGCGSGLLGLLLRGLSDYMGPKCVFHTASLVPSGSASDIVLETYNTVLALNDMTENSSLCSLFDLQASSHRELAETVAAMSWSSRFPGPLNADLRRIHQNLVPFKNCHFLTSALVHVEKSLNVRELTESSFHKSSLTINRTLGNRYLSTLLAYRGGLIEPSEVDDTTVRLQKNGSDLDPFFPDWIPNSLCASITRGSGKSLLTVTNTTAVHQFFDHAIDRFHKQFRAKSHLYVFEENGMHAEELLEALNLVQYVSDQYKEYAKYPDKVVIRGAVNEQGIALTHQQRLIANELLR